MKQKQKPNHLTTKDNLVGLIFTNTTKALDYFPFTLFTLIFPFPSKHFLKLGMISKAE